MITDLAPYQEHLDKMDLTEAQKLDLMNALWVICQGVVDQHFDRKKAD